MKRARRTRLAGSRCGTASATSRHDRNAAPVVWAGQGSKQDGGGEGGIEAAHRSRPPLGPSAQVQLRRLTQLRPPTAELRFEAFVEPRNCLQGLQDRPAGAAGAAAPRWLCCCRAQVCLDLPQQRLQQLLQCCKLLVRLQLLLPEQQPHALKDVQPVIHERRRDGRAPRGGVAARADRGAAAGRRLRGDDLQVRLQLAQELTQVGPQAVSQHLHQARQEVGAACGDGSRGVPQAARAQEQPQHARQHARHRAAAAAAPPAAALLLLLRRC